MWAPSIETLLALGKERQKSKVIPCTLNPKWREGFDLYWQEDTDDQIRGVKTAAIEDLLISNNLTLFN